MFVKLRVAKKLDYDFLRWLYPAGAGGALEVRSDMLGKLLVAHCRISETGRPDVPEGQGVAELRLPLNDATQNMRDKWLYYSPSDTAALNMAISSVLDLDFQGYYRKGESLGLQKKDIVEAYIISRNLFDAECFDSLHKRVYRREQEAFGRLTKKLLRKVYYINESIDYKGLGL